MIRIRRFVLRWGRTIGRYWVVAYFFLAAISFTIVSLDRLVNQAKGVAHFRLGVLIVVAFGIIAFGDQRRRKPQDRTLKRAWMIAFVSWLLGLLFLDMGFDALDPTQDVLLGLATGFAQGAILAVIADALLREDEQRDTQAFQELQLLNSKLDALPRLRRRRKTMKGRRPYRLEIGNVGVSPTTHGKRGRRRS